MSRERHFVSVGGVTLVLKSRAAAERAHRDASLLLLGNYTPLDSRIPDELLGEADYDIEELDYQDYLD